MKKLRHCHPMYRERECEFTFAKNQTNATAKHADEVKVKRKSGGRRY